MPNGQMTQTGITENGRIELANVFDFEFGDLRLFGAWKLGFRIFSLGRRIEFR
jgi:hypothetical protein